MIKKNYFLILFLFFGTSFFIFSLNKDNRIKINLSFADNILYNDKHILRDLTVDISKYIKDYDNSTDALLKSNKFIFNENELAKVLSIEEELKGYSFEKFDELLKESKFELYVIPPDENDESDYFLDIKIDRYTEGEYNLIRNRATSSVISVKFVKPRGEDKESVIFSLSKRYSLMPDIETPTEILRAKSIVLKAVKEVVKRLKLIYTKPVVSKKAKNEEEESDKDSKEDKKEDKIVN